MLEKSPAILVVGSIMADLILRVDHVPVAGESYIGKGFKQAEGGKGANQAVAASRLGANAVFVGKVGNDANGLKLKEQLLQDKVDISYLQTDNEAQTGMAVIILEDNGQNRIIVNPAANMELTPDNVIPAFNLNYDAVLLQLEMPIETVINTCQTAMKRNIPVILDAGPAQPFELERIKGLKILSPNETETYALTGIDASSEEGARKAATLLMRRSEARYVVIKLGKRGAMLYDGSSFGYFPAYEVKVVDTTAAGDAFTAAMTVEYIKSRDISRAIKIGNIAGALAVTKLGAQPSLPYTEDINAFENKSRI